MLSPKLPDNVKFSTTGIKQSYDFIVHNAGEDVLGEGCEFSSYGPLLRDYNVIRYCKSGQGILTINNKSFTISAGQCYVVMVGDVATEVCTSPQMSLSFVTLLGVKAPSYLSKFGISSNQPFFPWKECPEFLDAMKCVNVQIGVPQPNTEFMRCAEAYSLFYKLQQILTPKEDELHANEHLQEQYISDALYFMELNYTNKISVSDIAGHIGINRSYFYSLFKKHTGISPQEHLTRLRIQKACELFAYPHSTVVNVANALGLEASVFFRHFKRITGKTPSEYKQAVKNK